MQLQAPHISVPSRALAITAAAATAAVIGAGALVIGINSDDNANQVVHHPGVVRVDQNRVWDGSPILRGTDVPKPAAASSAASTPERVWDGSPLLRGTDVAPSLGAPGAFQQRKPEGFHTQP
jgi:hypothetical protein